jgi:hypothetical protein
MTSTNIKIRFIRRDSNKDDVVDITRLLLDNTFSLSYTYGLSKKQTPTTVTLTSDNVFRWMRHTISLLEQDDDPFESIQLDLPLMPSVMFKVVDLDEAYHALLNALEFHLDNWPLATEEEANSTIYDDMPPLESQSYDYNTTSHFSIPYYTHANPMGAQHHLFLDKNN